MKAELLEQMEPAKVEPTVETGMVLMIERLAANPNVDVDKLRQILEMQKDVKAHEARVAFNTAFAQMQGEIPVVVERAKTNNGTYAPLEDIQDAIRPILQRHGFYLSFRTEWPNEKTVKVIGMLTHKDGHERTSEFLSGADASGNKNAIQGLGSAVSYGRRYTTKDLLNITSRGADDDGYKAGKPAAAAPAGYEKFVEGLQDAAGEGLDKLEATFKEAFKNGKTALCNYMTNHDAVTLAKLKAKARGVK